ncbi:MAG: helix-turn-helix transcriptional regulator [Alphaproteobacteria bacterium]|nr:helix-turn-helix transcriptional regulator [Alphaproteobacteria bacterium]
MLFFTTTTFSLIELLAIIGLTQSILVLVYILFRVRNWRQASLALAYFFVLAIAFGLQFSLRLEDYEQSLRLALWFCWSLGPPLCYLLVLQVAKGVDIPEPKQFWILALVPLSFIIVYMIRDFARVCGGDEGICPGLFLWLYWLGSISGGIAMLALWGNKDLFKALRKSKGGRERYWLVIVLVGANVMTVGINSLRSTGKLSAENADSLLVVLGLAFIYLTITTLFRVYPFPVQLNVAPTRFKALALNPEEKRVFAAVKVLMEVDKLYHEQEFSRADLAREIQTSENTLSRVINVAFGKSFPRLLSEFRVDDAKRMLLNQSIPVQVVAFEVGFNSLASFNRVFKEVAGETPSQYRLENGKLKTKA